MQKPERMERKTGSLISLGSRAMVSAALHGVLSHSSQWSMLHDVLGCAHALRPQNVHFSMHCTAPHTYA